MTRDGVLSLADRIVRPALDDRRIEEIVVREDEDWFGDPSIFVDVFLAPGARPLGGELSTQLLTTLNRELLAAGERRPSYLRVRDKAGEEHDEHAGRPG